MVSHWLGRLSKGQNPITKVERGLRLGKIGGLGLGLGRFRDFTLIWARNLFKLGVKTFPIGVSLSSLGPNFFKKNLGFTLFSHRIGDFLGEQKVYSGEKEGLVGNFSLGGFSIVGPPRIGVRLFKGFLGGLGYSPQKGDFWGP